MALKAAAHCLLIEPSGDNDESEKGRLIVVQNDVPERKIFRGVVLHKGSQVVEDIERGDVAHYTGFHEIGDKHVVPVGHLIAWEDDE